MTPPAQPNLARWSTFGINSIAPSLRAARTGPSRPGKRTDPMWDLPTPLASLEDDSNTALLLGGWAVADPLARHPEEDDEEGTGEDEDLDEDDEFDDEDEFDDDDDLDDEDDFDDEDDDDFDDEDDLDNLSDIDIDDDDDDFDDEEDDDLDELEDDEEDI